MWRTRLMTALLIVVWLVTPDLLCLIPGVEMTADEHQCCEKMGSDCGQIPMPDMQGCCRTSTSSHAAIAARMTDYSDQRVLLASVVAPQIRWLNDQSDSIHWQRFEISTVPPLIPRDSVDILRI
jgi:hypothetical protein